MPETLPKKLRTLQHPNDAQPITPLIDMLASSFALGIANSASLPHGHRTWSYDLSAQIKKPVDLLGLGNSPATRSQQHSSVAPIHTPPGFFGKRRRYDPHEGLDKEFNFMFEYPQPSK